MIEITEYDRQNAEDLLRRLRQADAPDGHDLHFFGVKVEGFFDVTCRERDGSVAWEAHKKNLLTDHGRRIWFYDMLAHGGIFTIGSTETPLITRYSLMDSTGSCQNQSVATAPGTDWNAWTKSWSTIFGVPGSNRSIATVGLASYMQFNSGYGAPLIVCYSLITPVKVQTVNQTLEISYRLSMSPAV